MIKKLSELIFNGYKADFIEEEYSVCTPLRVEFYETPQPISESVSIKGGKKVKKILGIAEGVFSVLGGVSRNNRLYPEGFWESVAISEDVQNRIKSRRMLGTIGHYDKKIDTKDFAEGLVSHVITELYIDEENRVVIGKLEILDTPAGRLLKDYYESDLPLYISSRGAGKTSPCMNSSLISVDKNNYYLEGYDVVWDPGFWEAKPVYKTNEEVNNINEEKIEKREGIKPEEGDKKYGPDSKIDYADEVNNKYPLDTEEHVLAALRYWGMPKNKEKYSKEDQEKITNKIEKAKKDFNISEEVNKEEINEMEISTEKSMEEILKELLSPLQEELLNVKKLVEDLEVKINKKDEIIEETSEEKKEEEKKEEKEEKEEEKKEEDKKVSEEVIEETSEEKEEEEISEISCKDYERSRDLGKGEKKKCTNCNNDSYSKEKRSHCSAGNKCYSLEEKEVIEETSEEKEKIKTEDEIKDEHKKLTKDLESKKSCVKEDKQEEIEEGVVPASYEIAKKVSSMTPAEKLKAKKNIKEEVSEEVQSYIDELNQKIASLEEDKKSNEEYKNKIEQIVESIKERVKISSTIAEEYNKNKEQLQKATFELNARQISEEYSISIDEAKEKLKEKTIEQIKEEMEKEKEEKEKEKEEKEKEEIKESLKSVSEEKRAGINKPFNVKFISEEI